mmetsp:Transcript_26205/g.83759  ORF Transcript_26205/g.83759 Transcript_26205/m.83759 type:complete len:460 (-) Transcript_26205:361-1740(-)
MFLTQGSAGHLIAYALVVGSMVMCTEAREILQADTAAPTAAPTAADKDDDKDPIWMYCLIPIFSAIVGYATNVLALKMTFYPLEFWPPQLKLWQPKDQPFGLFGWQGIIPCKAGKMASIMTDMMTEKLFDIREIFGRMDPDHLAGILKPGLDSTIKTVVDKVAMKEAPSVWEGIPEAAKQEVYRLAAKDAGAYLTGLMALLRENITDVFDIKNMVVTNCERDKSLVVSMFQEVGVQEFKFIEKSGLYFGFLFGLVQAGVFYAYDAWWLLPLAGFMVGYLTNWIALVMIFQPVNPIKIGPFNMQGLFLKRQDEVSTLFGKLAADKYLRATCMWEEIHEGRLSPQFREMTRQHTFKFCDKTLGAAKMLSALILGSGGYQRVREEIARTVSEEIPKHTHLANEYLDKALGLEATIQEGLRHLPPDQFEGVLHPAFQEDEIKLIMVGGVLGTLVGLLQAFLVF